MSATTFAWRRKAESALDSAKRYRRAGDLRSAALMAQAAREAAEQCRLSALTTASTDMDDVALAEAAASDAEDFVQAGIGSPVPPTAAEVDAARSRLDQILMGSGR